MLARCSPCRRVSQWSTSQSFPVSEWWDDYFYFKSEESQMANKSLKKEINIYLCWNSLPLFLKYICSSSGLWLFWTSMTSSSLSTRNKLRRFGVMPHKQVQGRETPKSQNTLTTEALILKSCWCLQGGGETACLTLKLQNGLGVHKGFRQCLQHSRSQGLSSKSMLCPWKAVLITNKVNSVLWRNIYLHH